MNYQILLSHDDFVLILDTLRIAREDGIINWDAANFICEHTAVVYDEDSLKRV